MNRSRLVFLLVSGVLVLTILSGTLLGAPTRDDEGEDSLYKYLSVFTEVLRLVRQAYVDETDLDLLMNGALDGTPDALDPFSMYVPEDAVQGYLAARQVGESRSGLRRKTELINQLPSTPPTTGLVSHQRRGGDELVPYTELLRIAHSLL